MAYHRPSQEGGSACDPAHDEYFDIFSEFDFSTVDMHCDFFCPECRRMMDCMTYKEVKDGWESFYM